MVFSSPYRKVLVCDTPLHVKVLDAMLKTMDRTPDRIAFISAEDPSIRITVKELYVQAHHVASFLAQQNFGHLDVCCMVLPNCIQYAAAYLGVLLTGGAMSGASAMFTDYELGRQFLDSQCKVVVTDSAHLDKVLLAIRDCSKVKSVICVGLRDSKVPSSSIVVAWDDVLNASPTGIPKYDYNPDDMALLPYSSGTTGSPKGVMLSHRNFSTMEDVVIRHFDDHIVGKLGDANWSYIEENLLLMLPFYHIYGFGLMNLTLLTGMTGIVFKKFEPSIFFNAIQTYKPKMLMLVPPILLLLTNHQMVSEYDLSSIQFVLTGAAPAGKDLCDKFLRRFKHVRYLAQAYGMTECGMASHLPPLDSRSDLLSVGFVASTFEQMIISPETGMEVLNGQRGEICVRGPTVMRGYLGRPEATSETVDADGWLHTGDIGYLDEKGQLLIVDRLKELIKVKGLQVAPAELEDILLSHNEIHDAAVIGIPDEKTGEKPRAYVVAANANLKEHDVERFIEEKVSSYKFLTGGVVFVPEIPKSPAGKILRRLLREEFAQKSRSKL